MARLKTLQRPQPGQGRMIAGVCAAIANRFGVSRTLVRVLFVIFGVTGAGEVAYLVLWVLIPKEGDGAKRAHAR